MATGDARANDMLDAIYGGGHAAGIPSTVYFTIYTEAPDDDGGGTEAAYTGYARIALTNNDTNFPDAADREKAVAIEIELETPDEDVTVVAWAFHGHATNDDILTWEFFADPIVAEADKALTIEAGALILYWA